MATKSTEKPNPNIVVAWMPGSASVNGVLATWRRGDRLPADDPLVRAMPLCFVPDGERLPDVQAAGTSGPIDHGPPFVEIIDTELADPATPVGDFRIVMADLLTGPHGYPIRTGTIVHKDDPRAKTGPEYWRPLNQAIALPNKKAALPSR